MRGLRLLLVLALLGAVVYFGFFAARTGSHGLAEKQKQWALATCGVLTERNRGRHDLLGGCEKTEANAAKEQRLLEQWWGVENRRDLLDALRWVRDEGHRTSFEAMGARITSLSPQELNALAEQTKDDPEQRNQIAIVLKHYRALGDKGLKGWDYSRYVALCGWGYVAGYLSEKEAWDRIMPMARLIQETFDSWEELGRNYLIGRAYWSLAATQRSGKLYERAVERLCSNPNSPWVKLPWKVDLGKNPAKE
jgi:hypothetical protein